MWSSSAAEAAGQAVLCVPRHVLSPIRYALICAYRLKTQRTLGSKEPRQVPAFFKVRGTHNTACPAASAAELLDAKPKKILNKFLPNYTDRSGTCRLLGSI